MSDTPSVPPATAAMLGEDDLSAAINAAAEGDSFKRRFVALSKIEMHIGVLAARLVLVERQNAELQQEIARRNILFPESGHR